MAEPGASGAGSPVRLRAPAGAPPVRHPVGGTRLLAGLLLLVWLAGLSAALAVALAAGAQALSGTGLLVLAIATVLVGLGLGHFWHQQRRRELVWDGGSWRLLEGGREQPLADIEVRLDLQRALLLRCAGRLGPRWLWAQADARERARWHLLRCALYSESPPSSQPVSPSETASG
jgi:hypothetical protein